MRQQRIRALLLNSARGWSGDNLLFLDELPDLLEFRILDFQIQDVSPIHLLPDLRYLEVSTFCKTRIDFHAFPALGHCGLYWRKGAETLFQCEQLVDLFLNEYSGRESVPFSNLRRLESLTLLSARLEELLEFRALQRLEKLRLGRLRRLHSLQGIEALAQLRELGVSECRSVTQIDELAHLRNLRKLVLADNGGIATLAPLKRLEHLEWLVFSGSTAIEDGDLSPLLSLPALRTVSFQNRRHYSHTREEIAALLAEKR